jgi:cytochrome c556
MRKLFLVCALAALAGGLQAEEDRRQLVPMPAAAQANLRDEMLANLRALNDVLGLVAEAKYQAAGALAEETLGLSAMGKNRNQPTDARPGAHMPPAMHGLGTEGHKSASEFARIAATGDRDKTIAALPLLSGACVACHHGFRVR